MMFTERDLELAARITPKLAQHFWVLENGYAKDWRFSVEKPRPVPNQNMPWRRPVVPDVANRIMWFREKENAANHT